ncbi:rod-binding protein [Hydrogenovibrio sp. JE_KL2]|uniref:rod-binding protein n=1 Tax=Hydrogenovibrio sp. JE_KL2 TaxID=2651188 RepID=UPI00128B662A|nr:rod-binding protein [Hydrogenovibrio sp. JE_KL2]MPQ76961.1 flagellar biosynthesis [Hydrogenovibrio sp. JE_KL2]
MADMIAPSSDLKAYQQIYSSPNNLNELKLEAKKNQQAALKPVAQQFEALFLSQILKEASKVKFDNGWLDGGQADFYKDWYNQQIAQELSTKGSLGLADMIVKQLAPKNPSLKPTDLKANFHQEGNALNALTGKEGQAVQTMTTASNLASRPINKNSASAD